MHDMGQELRNVFQMPELDPARDFLRKFWRSSLGIQDLPESVVWRLLGYE
jgi:hypothetical protein